MRLATICAFGVATAAITILGYEPTASACGSAIADDLDDDRRELNRAEIALDVGDYKAARRHARLASGNRALQIHAMSFVRDRSASSADIERSVTALRQIWLFRDGDVISSVDLGEAVARMPGGKTEARALLEPLAQKDLIGSPHAYAALVRVGSTLPDSIDGASSMPRTADPGDKMMCVTGFTPETSLAFEARATTADRWMPRGFLAIGAIGLGSLVFAGVSCVRRVRRRSKEMQVVNGEYA